MYATRSTERVQERRQARRIPIRMTLRDGLYVLGQVGVVAGIELGDDALHAVAPHANAADGLSNALRVVNFERAHGFWIEPGLQSLFVGTHQILGKTIGWSQIRPLFDALYGQGHVLFTLAFAFWVFFFRRPLFSFLRNVFLLTSVLAVAIYEIFPLAPPRLAQGLSYDGKPYHFMDPVFLNGGIKLSFNEYAAMPSVHVAWALIVGLSLCWAARPLAVRILGLLYPLIMLTTVIVTGNHYVLDGMGAVAVVLISGITSLAFVAYTRRISIVHALRLVHSMRHQRARTENTAVAAVHTSAARQEAA